MITDYFDIICKNLDLSGIPRNADLFFQVSSICYDLISHQNIIWSKSWTPQSIAFGHQFIPEAIRQFRVKSSSPLDSAQTGFFGARKISCKEFIADEYFSQVEQVTAEVILKPYHPLLNVWKLNLYVDFTDSEYFGEWYECTDAFPNVTHLLISVAYPDNDYHSASKNLVKVRLVKYHLNLLRRRSRTAFQRYSN